MNQATLYDFESEKIKIDYLTFNIKTTEHNLQKIGIKSKKPYFSLINHSYMLEMVFVFHSNPANRNTILKSQKFNWQFFNLNDLTLGRLDINYTMLNQRIDKSKAR